MSLPVKRAVARFSRVREIYKIGPYAPLNLFSAITSAHHDLRRASLARRKELIFNTERVGIEKFDRANYAEELLR